MKISIFHKTTVSDIFILQLEKNILDLKLCHKYNLVKWP